MRGVVRYEGGGRCEGCGGYEGCGQGKQVVRVGGWGVVMV